MKISKISKALPWDINLTYGGLTAMVLVNVALASIAALLFFQTPWRIALIASAAIVILLVWILHQILGPYTYNWWQHFIGTDVDFDTRERYDLAQSWCWTNLPYSNLFGCHFPDKARQHTVRFRYRKDAVLAKLSV